MNREIVVGRGQHGLRRYVQSSGAVLAMLLAIAIGTPVARAQSLECIRDVQGADDEPGQKDLNQFCDALGNNAPYELTVNWYLDDTAWSGSNTGDACALFDTDGDRNANIALCVTVINGPPAVIKPGAPKLYSCSDTRPDRCVGSVAITNFASSCSVGQGTDPFNHSGNICKNTPGCRTTDTVVTCRLESNDVPGTESCISNRCSNIPSQFCLGDGDCIPITDVCSYPSEQPNSDPSDCVITPTGQDPCQGVSCSAFDTPCATASCNPQNGLCEILTPKPATTACTGTSNGGACDGADHCSGTSNTCVDGFQAAATTCRASAGQCDVAETCTGTSGTCPADGFQPSTATCTGASNGGACDAADHCSGTSNTCVDIFQGSTSTCRASAGQCDVAETCTGTSAACPADGFQPSTATCTGTSNGGACDGADHCSGTNNSCIEVFRASTVTCRASAGQCDVAETCTGTSATCPADGFQPSTASCTGTSNGGACDGADHCSGTNNSCIEVFRASTFTCRASTGQCDFAETCTGTSGACPADGFQPSSASCTGPSTGGPCDGTDHCAGTGNTCIDGFQPSTVTCRASTDQCDPAERCLGTSGTCPADALTPNGTACNDNNACTTADACSAGACAGGPAPDCDDANVCTVDTCDTVLGCTHTNATDGTSCSDKNACTLQDVCLNGECVGGNGPSSDPGCVLDTGGADDAVGQKDLTQFCQNVGDTCAGTILTWQWDDTGWTGSNTGDACALYDTDADGFANYALCVTVAKTPAVQLNGSPRLYLCTDGKAFNCTGATLVAGRQSQCVVNTLVPDPLTSSSRSANRCAGTNCLVRDTQAQCCVKPADFAYPAALIDVCSYPSQSPSSDPSECVKTVFCTNDNDCVAHSGEGDCQGRCISIGGVTQCSYTP